MGGAPGGPEAHDPAALRRPLARPRSTAGPPAGGEYPEGALLSRAGGKTEARGTRGRIRRPHHQGLKGPEARALGRRKRILSSRENFPGSFGNRPIPVPFPLVDNGALYFLPSLPQPPPQGGGGNIGHTAGTLAGLGLQARREGSCWRVTSGMRSVPPTVCVCGGQTGPPLFQMRQAPRGCRGGQVPTSGFFRDKDSIFGARDLERGI